jgi:glycine cleavage system H protein
MNTDPYGDGWLIEVRPATVGDVDALLTAAAYQDLVEKGH